MTPNRHHDLLSIWHLCNLYLVWFRFAWEIWRARYVSKHTLRSFSDATFCVYTAILCIHMYISIWCATAHDNKTDIAYDCTSQKIMALLPMMHRFIRTKSYIMTYELLQSIASIYMLWCLPITVDIINSCTLILKLIKVHVLCYMYFLISLASTHVPIHCNKFNAKQQRNRI